MYEYVRTAKWISRWIASHGKTNLPDCVSQFVSRVQYFAPDTTISGIWYFLANAFVKVVRLIEPSATKLCETTSVLVVPVVERRWSSF